MRLTDRLSEENFQFKDFAINLKRMTECLNCSSKSEDTVQSYYLTVSSERYSDIQSSLKSNIEQLF